MSKKNKEAAETTIETVEHALGRTEKFIEENQKSITLIVGVIVAIAALYLLTTRFYLGPKEKEAYSQMYVAEQYFEKDSFNLALNGDGQYPGFLEIIDSYKFTKASNLSRYYAGISYMQLGDYDLAIDNLKKFSSKDKMVSVVATGAIGDCLVELGEEDKALRFYLKAANKNKNEFTTPFYLMRAGLLLETLGDHEKALAQYEKIETGYPTSTEGRQIEKYIARAKLLIQ